MPQPDMIGIAVKDMAASLAFYRALGLDIPEGIEGESHVEVTTPNGYRIAWDTEDLVKEIHPGWEEPHGQRITIAFLCSGTYEVDLLFAKLTRMGHRAVREPWDAFWGQRYAIIADPDGNAVDLFTLLRT